MTEIPLVDPDVLVGLVGGNPVSLLVAAKSLRPRRMVLFATEQTQTVADRVVASLGGIPVRVVQWPDVPAIDAFARDAIADADLRPTERVVFDLTGATKTMTVGVWQALVARGQPFGAVCLMPDGRLVNARTGVANAGVVLSAQDHLQLHGYRVRDQRWHGRADQLPAALVHRAAVAQHLLHHFGGWQPNGRGWIRFISRAPAGPFAAPPTGADKDWIGKNIWLEELALACAAEACKGAGLVDATLSLSIQGDQNPGAQDESDVVLVRGARVVVIEAKASQAGSASGADLHKRVQKAESAFGQCRVVFFKPALSAAAIADLQPLVPKTDLVAKDLDQLRAAIARGLGL